MNKLFAIDESNQEIIVSKSQIRSREVNFLERIAKKDNETLYTAVQTLVGISKETNLDVKLFKAMDKICQDLYTKFKASA